MPYFDRFDICEAYYLFAYEYHFGGDTSDQIFHRLRRMMFKPSPFIGSSGREYLGLTENGWLIYGQLIGSHSDAKGC